MKYPGGYQIIDLGGVEIKTTQVELPANTYAKILASNKPVYLTNLTFGTGITPPKWGIRIACFSDDKVSIYSEFLTNYDGSARGVVEISDDDMCIFRNITFH